MKLRPPGESAGLIFILQRFDQFLGPLKNFSSGNRGRHDDAVTHKNFTGSFSHSPSKLYFMERDQFDLHRFSSNHVGGCRTNLSPRVFAPVSLIKV